MLCFGVAKVYAFFFGVSLLTAVTLDMGGSLLALDTTMLALCDGATFLGYEYKGSICAMISGVNTPSFPWLTHLYGYSR